MRPKSLLIFLCALGGTLAQLQAPPNSDPIRHSFRDRKSNRVDDDSDSGDSEEKTYLDDDNMEDMLGVTDENTITELMAETLPYAGSTIEIIKAPDLSQEKEAQKMTEMFSTLVNSHEKLIQKLKVEIEEIDVSIASLGEVPVLVQTQAELELERIYEAAMKILNRTRSDKTEGFALLKKAADKGHAKSRAKIAWAQLLGTHTEIDFDEAKTTFIELAEDGLPDAHMVSSDNVPIYIYYLHLCSVILCAFFRMHYRA